MAASCSRFRRCGVLSVVLLISLEPFPIHGFVPSSPSAYGLSSRSSLDKRLHVENLNHGVKRCIQQRSFPQRSLLQRSIPWSKGRGGVQIKMATDDFSEDLYTEAAWGCIASLARVADYYSATTVESPMLLDVMLNPSKHSAGDEAAAGKTVLDKVLAKAGVKGQELRRQLEEYMSKQPQITGTAATNANKQMGRSLQKVLEAARAGKTLLGVSSLSKSFSFVFHQFCIFNCDSSFLCIFICVSSFVYHHLCIFFCVSSFLCIFICVTSIVFHICVSSSVYLLLCFIICVSSFCSMNLTQPCIHNVFVTHRTHLYHQKDYY